MSQHCINSVLPTRTLEKPIPTTGKRSEHATDRIAVERRNMLTFDSQNVRARCVNCVERPEHLPLRSPRNGPSSLTAIRWQTDRPAVAAA